MARTGGQHRRGGQADLAAIIYVKLFRPRLAASVPCPPRPCGST